MSIFFEVKPGKITYSGRLIIKQGFGNQFLYTIQNFYKDDVKNLYAEYPELDKKSTAEISPFYIDRGEVVNNKENSAW